MIAILDWTGLGELVTCKIVEVLSMFQFSGALLIFVFFILVVVMTLVMPSTRKMDRSIAFNSSTIYAFKYYS